MRTLLLLLLLHLDDANLVGHIQGIKVLSQAHIRLLLTIRPGADTHTQQQQQHKRLVGHWFVLDLPISTSTSTRDTLQSEQPCNQLATCAHNLATLQVHLSPVDTAPLLSELRRDGASTCAAAAAAAAAPGLCCSSPDQCVDLLGLDVIQTLDGLLDLLLVSTDVNLSSNNTVLRQEQRQGYDLCTQSPWQYQQGASHLAVTVH